MTSQRFVGTRSPEINAYLNEVIEFDNLFQVEMRKLHPLFTGRLKLNAADVKEEKREDPFSTAKPREESVISSGRSACQLTTMPGGC